MKYSNATHSAAVLFLLVKGIKDHRLQGGQLEAISASDFQGRGNPIGGKQRFIFTDFVDDAGHLYSDVTLKYSCENLTVNLQPWSVLKISGQPYLSIASSNASTQNSVSSVVDTRHESTRREYQPTTAAKYTNPLASGIYVISVAQDWFSL